MRTSARSFPVCAACVLLLGFVSSADAAPKKKAPAKKEAAAPVASAQELNKLKGDFKWGMTPDQVSAEIAKHVEASYADRLKASINDPTKQDRVRDQLRRETAAIKKAYTKFEGAKSGYDVSIIDQEFGHGTNESMISAKEENATRYFFFSDEKLYKMFVAFDKEILNGKSFDEFGKLMQARFGKARDVYVDEKSKGGVRHKLDHFEWASKSGDGLRLVDRSEFYDVYCLVIYDGGTAERLAEARRIANPGGEKKDSLVEAVTNTKANDSDENDNVVDRIVGHETKKPGERAADIVVPSPSQGVHAPTPSEINRKEPASASGGKSDGDKKPAAKGGLEL